MTFEDKCTKAVKRCKLFCNASNFFMFHCTQKALEKYIRRRMVHLMLPFSGGKGLGVVLCPFCILLPYSECPERMLSVSIFTQLCYRIFLWNWLTHNLTFRWVLGQDVKSVNLQYNTPGCLDDRTNKSSTKSLMFQVLFFFILFIDLEHSKLFIFIFVIL